MFARKKRSLMESLEQRRFLSHAPLPLGFGALGDSFTDEYQFVQVLSSARNFVEQLAEAGVAYFGKFTTTARPSIRGAGYAFDWGFGGATSSDMAEEVAGLAPQVAAGKVSYVSILMGGNDFEHAIIARHPKQLLRRLPAQVFSRIQAGVDTLLAASPNVKIAISTLEELEETPSKQALVAQGRVTERVLRLADQEQDVVNADIRRMAKHDSRIVAVDFEAQLNSVSSQSTLNIGDVTVSTTTIGNDPHNLFLANGEHIGTIEQGLWGNLIISAVDDKFGDDFPLLTTAQILGAAGLS
jgi:hypothetical protein